MKQAASQRKITKMEIELKELKRAVFGEPDFAADTKAWKKVEKDVRKSRKRTFRRLYGKG